MARTGGARATARTVAPRTPAAPFRFTAFHGVADASGQRPAFVGQHLLANALRRRTVKSTNVGISSLAGEDDAPHHHRGADRWRGPDRAQHRGRTHPARPRRHRHRQPGGGRQHLPGGRGARAHPRDTRSLRRLRANGRARCPHVAVHHPRPRPDTDPRRVLRAADQVPLHTDDLPGRHRGDPAGPAQGARRYGAASLHAHHARTRRRRRHRHGRGR